MLSRHWNLVCVQPSDGNAVKWSGKHHDDGEYFSDCSASRRLADGPDWAGVFASGRKSMGLGDRLQSEIASASVPARCSQRDASCVRGQLCFRRMRRGKQRQRHATESRNGVDHCHSTIGSANAYHHNQCHCPIEIQISLPPGHNQ
jgi:hypothetical protein